MHIYCELYLDDCIVFAKTDSEYLNRLRDVFSRFRNYNIKLNPDKCRFGLEEVEYLGHVINSNISIPTKSNPLGETQRFICFLSFLFKFGKFFYQFIESSRVFV